MLGRVRISSSYSGQVQEDQLRLHEEYELECELRKQEKSEIESSEGRKALVSSAKGMYKAMKHSLLVRAECDKAFSCNFTNTIAPSFASFLQVSHPDMQLHASGLWEDVPRQFEDPYLIDTQALKLVRELHRITTGTFQRRTWWSLYWMQPLNVIIVRLSQRHVTHLVTLRASICGQIAFKRRGMIRG